MQLYLIQYSETAIGFPFTITISSDGLSSITASVSVSLGVRLSFSLRGSLYLYQSASVYHCPTCIFYYL